MALRRLIDAATEPITTAEAKAHLRVVSSTDDTLIDGLVKVCRLIAENELRRSLITQTWVRTLDEFPDAIELHYPPVIAVTSVKYYDTAGVQQTLDPSQYSLDYQGEPGWIVPAYNVTWPDTLQAINAVEVTYTAGYGAATDVPQAIKAWILLQVGHLYENREATVPGVSITPLPFVSALLDPYRVVTF
jgi:uncharacterized phiE125 gp8 family phage protein